MLRQDYLNKLRILYEDEKLEEIPTQWPLHHHGGRQSNRSMHEFVVNSIVGGQTVGRKEMAARLTGTNIQHEQLHWHSKGLSESSVGSPPPSAKTVSNYMMLAKTSPEARVTDKALEKTETRYTAEHSIRAAVSFAMTVAATSVLVGDPSMHC
jgi:hypothetical protein